MQHFQPGLVHTPVTPFKRDQSIDFEAYGKLIEFHLRNGAEALALPMPAGEDISLTDAELRKVLEFAIKQVHGRVPVLVHVNDAGTDIAVARVRHAEQAGAAAIVSHPPYFWHPKASMVVEHIARVGAATRLPFFVCSPPVEDVGTPLTTEIVLQVLERLDNLAGVVDASMDWVFMVEALSLGRKTRPEFQLLPGTDYMVSAGVVGGSGAFSPLSGIAPKLVREVYELCAKQQFTQARKGQEDIAALHHLVKTAGYAGLKGAMRAMGRDCGQPRPPARALGEIEYGKLAQQIAAMDFLR
ncbi:MAG: dihydrodipicolinate synthase family protein, partial [Pseudomonadota bacterium]